ncbi:MAG: pyrroline-5-carboxylate reductase, partial [Pseudomonadota bacterium]
MNFDTLERRGLILLGCGKMGSAMLAGWLDKGLPAGAVHILDPKPSRWLRNLASKGVHLNQSVPSSPAVALVAIKPQVIGDALPRLQALGNGETLFVSVAAGTPISILEAILGDRTPIVRAMPNTPASVGKGITALIGNARISDGQLDLAEALLGAVGQTVRLADEGQMDAVTAVSGSGPAYV